MSGASSAELAQVAPSAYSALTISGVVTLQNVVAQPGYWASATSSGLTYYQCPIPAACTQVPVSGLDGLAREGVWADGRRLLQLFAVAVPRSREPGHHAPVPLPCR